jgi:hypothetical protein
LNFTLNDIFMLFLITYAEKLHFFAMVAIFCSSAKASRNAQVSGRVKGNKLVINHGLYSAPLITTS